MAVEQEGKDQCRLPGQPRHLIFLPSILEHTSQSDPVHGAQANRHGELERKTASSLAQERTRERKPRATSLRCRRPDSRVLRIAEISRVKLSR